MHDLPIVVRANGNEKYPAISNRSSRQVPEFSAGRIHGNGNKGTAPVAADAKRTLCRADHGK